MLTPAYHTVLNTLAVKLGCCLLPSGSESIKLNLRYLLKASDVIRSVLALVSYGLYP